MTTDNALRPPSAEAASCDVLVIGGGPAGATVAPLLAQKGYRVVVLEKERHPRFHIGESLLPANLPLFERLGVADEVRAIGMQKWGAEFASPWHAHQQVFEFADAWDKSMPYAYQVRRSEFDHILIRNAARKGAEVREGCKVMHVDFLPDDAGAIVRARETANDGATFEREWHARFVIDASGRDTFLGNRLKLKHANPKHNSAAVYAHFTGAQRNEGQAAGNITISWFDHGWFWFIPLMDGVTSVGMVAWPYFMKTRKGRSLEQFLDDGIALCAPLAERLRGAQRVNAAQAAANFSYVSKRTHGRNYLLLGDAYAFIDPMFSSGVLLAMNSGFAAADTVDTVLRQPAQSAAALRRFDRVMKRGPKEYSWFIYRITNPIMRELFMQPSNLLRVKEAILSVLAGDIFGKMPFRSSLIFFKLIYHGASLRYFRRSWQAWQRRRSNIRPVDEAGATT